MQFNKEFNKEFKKTSKKIGVFLDDKNDPALILELLSVLFEDSDIEPVSFELSQSSDSGLLENEDVVTPFIIDPSAEIISPVIKVFDSDIFVLNYQKYYSF